VNLERIATLASAGLASVLLARILVRMKPLLATKRTHQPRELMEVRRRVDELAQVIGAPESSLPTYGETQDGARPHIEIRDGLLYFVVIERGAELVHEPYPRLDQLLERIFSAVTSEMASTFEARNRRSGEDFRRQMFALNIAYLSKLNPDWAARERLRLNEVLRAHPFTDGLDPPNLP
jgi:hypothetical protein